MNQILSINRIWIEFISDFPSKDKYCAKLWENLKWEVSIDDSDDTKESYVISTTYKYGGKDDNMETWTEPFGTSTRFYKWCSEGKNFLRNKFQKFKIECYKKRSNNTFIVYFKITKENK